MTTAAEDRQSTVGQMRASPQWRHGLIKAWFPLAALVIITGAIVLYSFNPVESRFYPICLFHATTGLLCPGCGSLRAVHQLLHGNFAVAIRYNLLCVASIPVVGGIVIRAFVCRMQGRDASLLIRPLWLWIGFAVITSFWILRNLPTPLKYWLGP
jgi:hypothetical protein